MLCDGNKHRLVVRSRVDRGELVGTSGEAVGDIGSQDAIHRSCVQTEEECELGRVGGSGLCNGGKLLDNDMGVSYDQALSVKLLGRGEIVGLRVHKVTGLQVADRHGDSKGRVRSGDVNQIGGELKLRRRHGSGRRNLTHRSRIARPGLNLLTIRDGLIRRGTEVDVVVRRCQGSNLAGFLYSLAVLGKARSDDRWVER